MHRMILVSTMLLVAGFCATATAAEHVISGLDQQESELLSTLLDRLEGPKHVTIAARPGFAGTNVTIRAEVSAEDVRSDSFAANGTSLAMIIYEQVEKLCSMNPGPILPEKGSLRLTTNSFDVPGSNLNFSIFVESDGRRHLAYATEVLLTTAKPAIVTPGEGHTFTLRANGSDYVRVDVAPRDHPEIKNSYMFRFRGE